MTAFLYAGLPGRGYWLTAVLAARFLASAFAAGPAFLILLCYIVRTVTRFDPGQEAIKSSFVGLRLVVRFVTGECGIERRACRRESVFIDGSGGAVCDITCRDDAAQTGREIGRASCRERV